MPPHFEIAATGPLPVVENINFGVVTTGKGFSDLYRPTAIVVLVIELVDVQLAQPPQRSFVLHIFQARWKAGFASFLSIGTGIYIPRLFLGYVSHMHGSG